MTTGGRSVTGTVIPTIVQHSSSTVEQHIDRTKIDLCSMFDAVRDDWYGYNGRDPG